MSLNNGCMLYDYVRNTAVKRVKEVIEQNHHINPEYFKIENLLLRCFEDFRIIECANEQVSYFIQHTEFASNQDIFRYMSKNKIYEWKNCNNALEVVMKHRLQHMKETGELYSKMTMLIGMAVIDIYSEKALGLELD